MISRRELLGAVGALFAGFAAGFGAHRCVKRSGLAGKIG